MTYTVITFAPVQGFIEKSRKLRDLYGSSFLLSYLADAICQAAHNHPGCSLISPALIADKHPECSLISPALIHVKRGTPNQILIAGNFPENEARNALNHAWKTVVNQCRDWIEKKLPQYNYTWRREWNLWINHTWEFFWAQGDEIHLAFKNLQQKKYQRDWTGIKWQGESSSLSGSDAIVWYGMTDQTHPLHSSISEQSQQITEFYQELSQKLSEAILDPDERLSIPELVKRMVTLYDIGNPLGIELPKNLSN
jgi:CRISPR-associated protein Cmr2